MSKWIIANPKNTFAAPVILMRQAAAVLPLNLQINDLAVKQIIGAYIGAV